MALRDARWRRWARTAAIGWAVLAGASLAHGEVRWLVIGGGPDVYRNQVFFEKNVGFFRDSLGRMGNGKQANGAAVFFASGKDVADAPDLGYVDPKEQTPRVSELLSRIFEGQGDVEVRYRPHEVRHVAGPARKADVTRWFETDARGKMSDGDVLAVYVTAHGGGSEKQNDVGKSTIALWGDETMSVAEFTALLEKVPAGVRVVTVMVQCYCGGFGEIVYEGARVKAGGLAKQSRCGFFATLATMTATGCTASTRDEEYTDYSTNFFAALGMRDRAGHTIEKSKLDLDGDGRVSMAEAHAYAELAGSVDVPTTTSELYLRRVSKVDGATALNGQTYDAIRGRAGKVHGAVLETLGRELELSTWKPAATTPRRRRGAAATPTSRPSGDWLTAGFGVMNECEGKARELEARGKRLGERYYAARDEIRNALQARWPELAVTWHPKVAELVRDHAGDVIAAIEGQPAYTRFQKEWDDWQRLQAEEDAVNVRHAKAQRFLRTAATVALEMRLGDMGEKEREGYKRLVEAEGWVDGP